MNIVFCSNRNLQDDFENYQQSIQKLSEESRQQIQISDGAICEICHKTKFADGIGHKCHYCGLKSCARCGSKISLRTNKVCIFLNNLKFFKINLISTTLYSTTSHFRADTNNWCICPRNKLQNVFNLYNSRHSLQHKCKQQMALMFLGYALWDSLSACQGAYMSCLHMRTCDKNNTFTQLLM